MDSPRGLESVRVSLEAIGHYRIIRKLGAGGMGEVFLAEDTRLGRKVAIKMLSERLAGSYEARQRLINEARAAAALDHPNICAIYEVGEDGEHVFIVMQYVEGERLAERIWKHPMPSDGVADIGIQVAQALQEAHAAGIIHRDIKPQNIIVTPRGQVKVLDFGLAKVAKPEVAEGPDAPTWERLTEAGRILGTPGFMSPEQLKGQAVDARSDIFSLGVTLYECATGVSAFEGATPLEVSLRVVADTPPPPSAFNHALDPALDRIIMRAMARDPLSRYESAQALHADLLELMRALERPDAPSRPASTVTADSNRWSVRRKALVVAGAVGVLLAAWLAPGLWRRGQHVPTPEAMTWYERGTRAIRDGAYFQAERALERAIALDDAFALAHVRRAEAYSETELVERAREEMVRAMTLLPDRSGLSTAESLYVDAVAATLSRDFETAIDKHAAIVNAVPDSDKAAAYVDLGRAYEKNESIDDAIAAYAKAAQLDPQSAAAFLRTGILHGRRLELEKANDAFARAQDIYQAMSSQEGLAEVFYQRGSVLARIRRLPDARAELERSLEVSRSASNDYQSIRTELQLSNVYYAEGNSARAQAIASRAIDAARQVDSRTLAINGLIDLGYTLLARGEFADTRTYLDQAMTFARQARSPGLEARAHLALGSLSTQVSDLDAATSHLESALKFFAPAGYRRETANALILLGRAARDKGDYAAALKAFSDQLELAKQSGDPARLAASHSSLGVLLGDNQELYPQALAHFDESYRINQSLGARVGMGVDQINRAAALRALGRYEDARTALTEARSSAADPDAGFKSQLAWVELTDAQIALSLGRLPEARTRAAAALTLAASDYKDVALLARQVLALVHASSGRPKEGAALADEAVDAARALKVPRLLSTALLTSAEVRLAGGQPRAALAEAQAAQQMFAGAAQTESEWRALLVAARSAALEGASSTAYDYATRAESSRAALQTRWGDDHYRGYAQRPDIQARVKQLAQLLAAGTPAKRIGGQ
jgi:tetratricopeptide (TPR) repeat protein/tRNA A-37 threonylcarbamoyl transferase component Bud32